MYSTTIAAVIVNLLATILPLVGIQVGSDSLTTTIQTIVAIGTGFYIWYQRTTLQKSPVGDVNGLGFRK